MLEVEVMVDHEKHLFVLKIDTVLEAPEEGASIECRVCGKKNSQIIRVGIPHRIGNRSHSVDENQKSILE